MSVRLHRVRTGRGYSLRVSLTIPRGAKSTAPVAVLCHGLGVSSQYPLLAAIGRRFARAGYPVIQFDFAGHGESGGRVQDRLVRNFIDDLATVIAWMKRMPDLDGRGFFLVGHSIGALTALIAASRRPRSLRGVVLIACNAFAAKKYHQLKKVGKVRMLRNYGIVGRSKVSRNFWGDRMRYEPRTFMPRVTCSTLFVCGSEDVTNRPAESRMLYRWTRARKRLRLIRATDHYFRSASAQKAAARCILEWTRTV